MFTLQNWPVSLISDSNQSLNQSIITTIHYTEPEEGFISQKLYILPTEHLHDILGKTISGHLMILDAS